MATERLRLWRERDDAHAVNRNDREASEGIDPFRLKLADASLDAIDFLRMCTSLGTSLAHSRVSPAFVTSVISNLTTLPHAPPQAGAALFEAYVQEVRELERTEVCTQWSRGWQQLDPHTAIAIADPPPDHEIGEEWLSKVASEIARSGVREVRLSGRAADALASLLSAFEIRIVSGSANNRNL